MDLKELGEFGLIERIKSACHSERSEESVLGIGDDCAVLPQADGLETLVTTDMLLEGSHFLRDDIPARLLGWKSAAVNFSDIAAMGGRPVGTFLSLGLPKGLSVEWMDEFIAGFKECSDFCGAPLLGGDTTTSQDGISINVTVLGECQRGRSLKRSDAVAGDLVCVTGPLGDSAGGLKIILARHSDTSSHPAHSYHSAHSCHSERSEESRSFGKPQDDIAAKALVERHYRPTPRIREGLALAATSGVHAMMDISDGIASDLRHILKASGVGASIDTQAIPLSPELKEICARYGWDALELALSGGEDYELLFTMAPDAKPDIPYYVIGRITEGEDITWQGSDRDFTGFRHF